MADIAEGLHDIFDRQNHAFKINLSFGFIMRHVETGRYRYFRPYDNVNVFNGPILISSREDITKVTYHSIIYYFIIFNISIVLWLVRLIFIINISIAFIT